MRALVLQKAIAFVSNGLEQHTWNEGDQLPSIMDLACQCGVARATMWKAIHKLGNEGKVSIRHGAGVVAGKESNGPQPAAATISSHSFQAKRILFEQDILKGIFAPGQPLPSIGELQARYGVSYRTMSKILNTLAADRILETSRKKYFLKRTQGAGRGSVCLLWEGLLYSEKPRLPREERIVEAFQKESSLAKTQLHFLSFDP